MSDSTEQEAMDGTRSRAERQMAMAGLPTGDALLAAIVESSEDAILSKTLDGTILSWNAGAEKMYGYRTDEMLGQNISLLFPEDRREERQAIMSRLARGQRVEHFETVRRRRDGSLIDVSVTISPLRDINGEVIAASTIARDITARKQLERLLAHRALHDPVTGLANRILAEDRLGLGLRAARRSGLMVTVLFVDLDHFKAVNDRYGHPAGDRALLVAAQRIAGALRAADTVARFGGDEFVAVCPEISGEAEALDLADRVMRAVRVPFELDSTQVALTASVGVALGRAEDDPSELIRRADTALYRAKSAGRSRSEVFRTEA